MYFKYNLHPKNTILYVTLNARSHNWSVKTITHSSKATVVLRWYVSDQSEADGFLHDHSKWSEAWNVSSPWFSLWDKHGSLYIFPLLLQFFELLFFILDLLNSTPFTADKRHASPRPLQNHFACTSLRPGEEAAETIWHVVNIVSMCQNTFNFFSSLVIFRHYFTGNRKVSCILAPIPDWFPNKKILKQKLCHGFLY